MRAKSNKNIKFRSLKVKGQSSTEGGVVVTGWPYTISDDAQIVANPYLDAIRDVVQSIAVGSCTNANTGKMWTGTVQRGNYCGDTVFDGAMFEPGPYQVQFGEQERRALVLGRGHWRWSDLLPRRQ